MFEKEGVLTKLVGAFQSPSSARRSHAAAFFHACPCFSNCCLWNNHEESLQVRQASLSTKADLCFWQDGRATSANQWQSAGKGLVRGVTKTLRNSLRRQGGYFFMCGPAVATPSVQKALKAALVQCSGQAAQPSDINIQSDMIFAHFLMHVQQCKCNNVFAYMVPSGGRPPPPGPKWDTILVQDQGSTDPEILKGLLGDADMDLDTMREEPSAVAVAELQRLATDQEEMAMSVEYVVADGGTLEDTQECRRPKASIAARARAESL